MDSPKKTLSEPLSVPSPSTVQPRLIPFSALPPWRQDNHYILSSHRQTSNAYLLSLHSLTYLHNESVNIFTHLIPAVLFLYCTPLSSLSPCLPSLPSSLLFVSDGKTYSEEEVFVLRFFFLGAVLCLGISAAYHTVSNHSPKVNQWGNQADYVGIVALITGSFVPCIYYGFWDEPGLRRLYWTMV